MFDDFIAAAEWLIANRYTSPPHLATSGGSNGGLLVGAAFTQRPELFKAVVCSYPLLDMIRYHGFFVAGYWVPECGSSADSAQFKTLYAYDTKAGHSGGVPISKLIDDLTGEIRFLLWQVGSASGQGSQN